MNPRRIISSIAAAFAIVLFTTTAAVAGSGHFIAHATTASSSGSTLTVKFKEAGLESGATETITVSAHLDATYACINGGGKNPSDPKKKTVSSDVSYSADFTAGKNGNVTGSLSVSAPAASGILDCPNGQTATLVSVTWTNVSIYDRDSGAFLAIPGTY